MRASACWRTCASTSFDALSDRGPSVIVHHMTISGLECGLNFSDGGVRAVAGLFAGNFSAEEPRIISDVLCARKTGSSPLTRVSDRLVVLCEVDARMWAIKHPHPFAPGPPSRVRGVETGHFFFFDLIPVFFPKLSPGCLAIGTVDWLISALAHSIASRQAPFKNEPFQS